MANVSFDEYSEELSYGTPVGDLGVPAPQEFSPMWTGLSNLFQAIPPIWLSASANPARVRNTIIHGGFMNDRKFARNQWMRQGGQGSMPTRFGRYFKTLPTRGRSALSTRMAHPSLLVSQQGTRAIDPFQLSQASNFAMKQIGRSGVASRAINSRFGAGATEHFFEQGLIGKMGAAAKLNQLAPGSDAALNAYRLAQANYKGTGIVGHVKLMNLKNYVDAGKLGVGDAMLLSSRGATGRFMGGFGAADKLVGNFKSPQQAYDLSEILRSGGQAARFGAELAEYTGSAYMKYAGKRGLIRGAPMAMKGVMREAAIYGGKRAAVGAGAKFMAGLGTKIGATASSGPAAPIVGAAMTAWLAYDLTKLTVGGVRDFVIRPAVNIATDSIKSMKGSIEKPTFGMGFVDNEVAATSRARGVQAIQNSRLNARSVLGSEASALYNHFR